MMPSILNHALTHAEKTFRLRHGRIGQIDGAPDFVRSAQAGFEDRCTRLDLMLPGFYPLHSFKKTRGANLTRR